MRRLEAHGLKAWIHRRAAELPQHWSPATGSPEALVVGLHPRRILVVGSGLAVGWGAPSHDAALTGALGRAFDGMDGRGVIVHNRALSLETVWSTMRRLGPVGAATFDVVVWSPCLCDVVHSPARGRYRRAVLALLDRLHSTSTSGSVLVVGGVPQVTGPGPFEDVARRVSPRFNASLERAVRRLPGTVVVPPPPVSRLLDADASDSRYYDRWASAIARAVREPVPVPVRAVRTLWS